jgi:hypothetical protein
MEQECSLSSGISISHGGEDEDDLDWVPIYAFISSLPQMIGIVRRSYYGQFSVVAVQA